MKINQTKLLFASLFAFLGLMACKEEPKNEMAEAEKRTRDKESQVSSELAKAKKINDEAEAKIVEYTNKIENLEKKNIKAIAKRSNQQ